MWASHPGFPGLQCPPRADKDTIYKTTSGNPHQENVATTERGWETEGAGRGGGSPGVRETGDFTPQGEELRLGSWARLPTSQRV